MCVGVCARGISASCELVSVGMHECLQVSEYVQSCEYACEMQHVHVCLCLCLCACA